VLLFVESLFRSEDLQQSRQRLQMLVEEQLLKAGEVETEIAILSQDTGMLCECVRTGGICSQ